MASRKIYDEPSTVIAEEGCVVMEGPNDLHIGLTPDAAEETSNRLLEEAMKARGQKYFSRDRRN